MTETSHFDIRTIAALLRAQGETIADEMTAVPPEVCGWRPVEGEWSMNETLGHIVEAERRGFNGRIRKILAFDNPELPGWQHTEVARERRDHERNPIEVLLEFETLRADSVGLVESLRPEQLQRRGKHERVGEISVNDLLHEWMHHDRNHVKQMMSVVQAYVWPQMGNCRQL